MWAVIRIRGSVRMTGQLKDTLALMQLHAANHCVVLAQTPANKGMIDKIQAYVTYGPIDEETLVHLIEKRGRTEGDKRIDTAFLKKSQNKSVKDIAKAVMSGKKLKELGIKNVFRLNPPKKGFERIGIKKPYNIGGALGPRGVAINALLEAMI